VRGADELAWLLQESDFVALCSALTHETRQLIGEQELRLMKRTAYLINVGRGGLVDEQALIGALRGSEIAGAGLDVFEREPLAADSPLWDLPNVMITPHDGGSSPRSHERFMGLFLENLRRYVAGEPLLNVVDKRAGY
jgi:phosphoglycerate dehydrogenase-like enzyme